MQAKKWGSQDIRDLNGLRAVVTGANSGIGYETALVLAQNGAHVVLACRSKQRGEQAVAKIRQAVPNASAEFAELDLADLDSVRGCAQTQLELGKPLDLLVNNAGIMMPPLSRTKQGFELQFGVNHLGHFVLSALLFPLLQKAGSARLVTVASNAHKHGKMGFADLNYERRRYSRMAAYGQSKLANLLFTLELARRLEASDSNVTALAAHPGWTSTNLMTYFGLARLLSPHFAMSPSQGALPTLRAATDPSAQGAAYYGPDGLLEMWGDPAPAARTKDAHDKVAAARLWELSESLTKQPFQV